MSREVLPNVHWIYEDGPDRSAMFQGEGPPPDWYDGDTPIHIPQCAYLLTGNQTLLFDTLSPASTDKIVDETRAIVGEDGLDYLVISHPDVPHAGNTLALLEAFPSADLIAPAYGNDHELYRLDTAQHVSEGDTLDLGGLTVAFHEATFLDSPVHLWMSETSQDILFPVDWLGFPHLASDGMRCVDELSHPITKQQLVEFHGRVMFWHQYVDTDKVKAEIDYLIEKFRPAAIAPAHGLVIREDAIEIMKQMKPVVEEIATQDRIGTLG